MYIELVFAMAEICKEREYVAGKLTFYAEFGWSTQSSWRKFDDILNRTLKTLVRTEGD